MVGSLVGITISAGATFSQKSVKPVFAKKNWQRFDLASARISHICACADAEKGGDLSSLFCENP